MQQDKLLMKVGGVPVVERVIRAASSSKLSTVVLVYRSDAVMNIGRRLGVTCVANPDAGEGQSAAVRLGVHLSLPDSRGYMFLVGDQPFIQAATINRLLDAWVKRPGSITVPLYSGRRGNPVIFPADLRNELLALAGDTGGRVLLETFRDRVQPVDFCDAAAGIDIDTREEYDSILSIPIDTIGKTD